MPVEFREIEGFQDYWVDNEGNVWSGRHQIWMEGVKGPITVIEGNPTKKLKQSATHRYKHVTLHKDGKQNTRRVHKLVLEAFHGPAPFPDSVCRHLDGDSLNNRADNLAWGTQHDNIQDKRKHGNLVMGEDFWSAKLTEDDVRHIRSLPKKYGMFAKLARKYNMTTDAIRNAYYGKTWQHVK